jgi:hypothetical protein
MAKLVRQVFSGSIQYLDQNGILVKIIYYSGTVYCYDITGRESGPRCISARGFRYWDSKQFYGDRRTKSRSPRVGGNKTDRHFAKYDYSTKKKLTKV